ncbi:ATP/GTP-binding protein [Streptomyces sp. B1866]|uniref:ATP/GTP-binding protein n=1 Tax=Streptomyces sp. B1866 TaxID=3075431 RepID=UPI00288DF9AD|nr:ATP/GTP-binding protein [Streptomyces sp. B1866]MDT3398374.1 ATP/GTP-binding protein [Streptomyces sp. B1866]
MSPRRNRPRGGERSENPVRLPGQDRYGLESTESWRDEEWIVRQVGGGAAVKHYRCPGCDQEIPPGMPHVVVWQRQAGVDDRRHWHKACWSARDRRGARLHKSRQAPRY